MMRFLGWVCSVEGCPCPRMRPGLKCGLQNNFRINEKEKSAEPTYWAYVQEKEGRENDGILWYLNLGALSWPKGPP